MKRTELVNYFRSSNAFERFCARFNLNPDSDSISIAMAEPYSIGSELEFFEVAETNGRMPFLRNGISYPELFDFHYFNDFMSDLPFGAWADWSDLQIAERLLTYGVNDA